MSISEPLLRSAKQRAAQRGITLSALIEDALREYIGDAEPHAEPAFRLYTVRGKLVNPGLDLDRTSALVEADDEAGYFSLRS